MDALDEYVRGIERYRLAALDDDVRTELAHVFPSLTVLATEGDVAGQQRERVLVGCRFDRPPDCVPAGATRGKRWLVTQRALVSFERGEDDAAVVRLVAVVE